MRGDRPRIERWLALLVAAFALPLAGAEGTVAVPAGAAVREVASPVGRLLWTTEAPAELPVLDRSGDWVRVADGERSGWVELPAAGRAAGEDAENGAAGGATEPDADLAATPSAPVGTAAGSAAAGDAGASPAESDSAPAASGAGAGEDDLHAAGVPATPLAGSVPGSAALLATADPSAARLVAAARDALADEPRVLSWGRFTVLTDLGGHPLLALGERIAADLPALHARRYGFADPAPRGAASEAPHALPASDAILLPPSLGTVVLFAREADYSAFHAATAATGGGVPAADLAGHAAGGVAALPLAGRTAGDAASTLVHELAHLLNRRRWGDDLPPWLDEGLAGDLELVEIGDGGELDATRWAAGPPGRDGRRTRTGPLVALDRLLADARRGRLETVAALVALDRPGFAASPRSLERYALAALWVRYLLDDPARAAAFRGFLAALAAAPPPADGGAALLAEALGTDLATLDRPLHLWLHDLARRK